MITSAACRWLLLGLACVGLRSAGREEPRTRPAIQVFSTAEGLPSTTVHDIRPDRDGRLWIATVEGPAVYNGRRWSTLTLPGASGSKWVRVVRQTTDGSLWFGTDDGGLWRKQGQAWEHFDAQVLGSERVNTLLEVRGPGRSPTLWVGTGGGGLARYQDGVWTRLTPAEGFPDTWVWHLAETSDAEGRPVIWACTRKGLARLEAGRWRTFTTRDGLPGDEINSVVAWKESSGAWTAVVSCWGKGLARWSLNRWVPFGADGSMPSRFFASLAVTRAVQGDASLWAGSFDEGLFRWDGNAWSHITVADGLPSNAIYGLYADSSRRPALWIGTRGGGLASLDLAGWRVVDRSLGLPSGDVTAFLEVPTPGGGREILLGTSKGLAGWDGARWRPEGPPPETGIHPHVYALHQDGQGRLYMGSISGVAVRERGRWSLLTTADGLPSNHVNCILPSQDGGLLVGTGAGIGRLEGRRARTLSLPPEVPQPTLYALLETRDPGGETVLWAGTRGDGLLRFSKGHWARLGPEQGFPARSVHALLHSVDSQGRRWLWAGTSAAGLLRLELDRPGAAWERFDQETLPGFPSNAVASLKLDPLGRLLVGTKRGVARLSLVAGRPAVETFALADGLPSLSCNTAAALVDHLGHVWIGTPQGAAVLDPAREEPMPPLPRPYLDQVRVAGQSFLLQPGVALGHRQNQLAFTFGIARFQREESIRFRTQLEGLEAVPGPWTLEETREFAALPKGRYRLVVWAQDHLGHVSEPVAFPFEIKAAPWRTPLAYLLYAAAAAAVLLGLHRLRVRILKEQNRVMAQRIHEHTARLRQNKAELQELNAQLLQLNQAKNTFLGIAAHDLKSPLSALALEGELLSMGGLSEAEVAQRGAQIQEAASRMSQLVTKLLDVHAIESRRMDLDLAPVDLAEVVHDLRLSYEGMARAKAIRIELEVPGEGLPAIADPMHLREILENLVSNAIKFTPPGPPERHLWIRARREAARAILEVQDQGPGFTEDDKRQAFESFARLSARPTGGEDSTGLGLSIVKRLVEAMGGTILLVSEAGQGATFRIELPLPQS
ncbi:MAG: two-component regulator propeller domain-containing protein [Holophagaceae bacterium]